MSVTPRHDSNREQSHLSIGEVLNILREEFPDITISKIRFLESQGLVDPERTPSGYRKFYVSDVSRLRWILHQQKENFLPLKVIKERLDNMGAAQEPAPVHSISRSKQGASRTEGPQSRRRTSHRDLGPELPLGQAVEPAENNGEGEHTQGDEVAAAPARAEPAPPRGAAPKPEPKSQREPKAQPEPKSQRQPKAQPEPKSQRSPEPTPAPARDPGLTRRELARAAGLEDWQMTELESFGLLSPVAHSGNDARFDEQGEAIAKAAAGFYAHGIGGRHLRMYKIFAEREAALFEQVLLPYLRQRNPASRTKAQEDLASLSKLGRALRSALFVHAVREALHE